MLNVPQVFRKFIVVHPSTVDGTECEEYFDEESKMFLYINQLRVPYTVYALYECLTWTTVKCDANGSYKSVVNKF